MEKRMIEVPLRDETIFAVNAYICGPFAIHEAPPEDGEGWHVTHLQTLKCFPMLVTSLNFCFAFVGLLNAQKVDWAANSESEVVKVFLSLANESSNPSAEAVNSHGLLAEAEMALQKIINKSGPMLSGENDKKFSFQALSSIEEIAEVVLARIRAAREVKQ